MIWALVNLVILVVGVLAARHYAWMAHGAAHRARGAADRAASRVLEADRVLHDVQQVRTEVLAHPMHCSSCGIQAASAAVAGMAGKGAVS